MDDKYLNFKNEIEKINHHLLTNKILILIIDLKTIIY